MLPWLWWVLSCEMWLAPWCQAREWRAQHVASWLKPPHPYADPSHTPSRGSGNRLNTAKREPNTNTGRGDKLVQDNDLAVGPVRNGTYKDRTIHLSVSRSLAL